MGKNINDYHAIKEKLESVNRDPSNGFDPDQAWNNLEQSRYEADTNARKSLSLWTMVLITFWLCAVIIILVLNSLWIHLSDKVLMMLLGTTTANVIGLAQIVLKGYYKYMDQNAHSHNKGNGRIGYIVADGK